ncbi:ECF RNA polymerase sigma factor SigW [compost metagenome]
MNLSDNQLAALWSNGDPTAFNSLLELYKDKIYRMAYRILGNKNDSEDVVQETFLRMYLNRERFDDSKNFSNWIYSIGKNITIDLLRKKKSKISMDTSVGTYEQDSFSLYDKINSPEQTPEMQLIQSETKQQMHDIMEKLPAKYKDIFVYKYVMDMSLEEISALSGLPVTTIKTRLFRGRNLIKQKWGSFLMMVHSFTPLLVL